MINPYDYSQNQASTERSPLVAWVLDSVPDLYSASQAGDAHRAIVSVRRALAQLRDIDPSCAKELNKKLRAASPRSSSTRFEPNSSPLDRDSHAPLLRPITVHDAPRPRLPGQLERVIDELIVEQHALDKLLVHDVQPRWTLLLSGPPGVGKTMLARWLACTLGIPLVQLELPAVLSSYLGRTGQNLRNVLDFARTNRVVLLLDEFDAIAKKRDDPRDLGELNRIVSVLLKDLEDWSGPSLVVAATNHQALIDPAIFRRFSLSLRLPLPDAELAGEILGFHLGEDIPSTIMPLVAALCEGMNGSDLHQLAQSVRRGVLLSRYGSISQGLLQLLAERVSTPDERTRFVSLARANLPKKNTSLAKLAALLGVSKSTVHAAAKSTENED